MQTLQSATQNTGQSQRRHRCCVALWAMALMASTAGNVHAQTAPAAEPQPTHAVPQKASAMTDSIHTLDEVLVKGQQQLTPVQTIGRKQITGLASNSVADALKYMAGVQIKDYGGLGGQKTINVRSLGSQHVGVYIDGVRITNVQNGTVDLGKYSLATLESVQLFNANKSELLMAASEYASASTVYLKTHRPDSTSLTASASLGSFGTQKATLNFSFRDYGFIDAQYTHSDGDYPFRYHTEYEDTTGTRRNADIKLFRIESCLFYKDWQWHTYYFQSERGLPGGIVRRMTDRYTDVGREWDRNFFSQLTYRKQWGHWGVRGIAKYTNDKLHYRSDYDNNISVKANNQYLQQDMYAAVAGSYTYKGLGLSASTDYRWSDLDCDVKRFNYVYRLDSKTSLAAAYSHKGLNLNLAALYTHTADHTRRSADPQEKVTWNALASYTTGPLSYRFFYKTVFRTPTLNDLYYTLVGNRSLKPEYTKQWNVGVTYTQPWLRLQVDAYINKVEDRIVCLPLKGALQWTMLNYGYTRCMGVNASANVRHKQHNLFVSATYQDDRNRTDPEADEYNDYIAYSPRWSASAIYTFEWRGFTANVSYMFVDKRYWTAENAIEEPLDAYQCWDAKLTYRYKWLTIEEECQNIFDKPYEVVQRWPMPGRRWLTTLKVTL